MENREYEEIEISLETLGKNEYGCTLLVF